MEANIERLMNDIETVASYNRTPGKGYTRFSYSKEDLQSREYLLKIMENMDLTISIDALGNIRARYEGINPREKPILIGSHIDTVLHGGKFDGLLGVVASIEAVRVLQEENFRGKHPIEIIIFSEEEGSNFRSATFGSKALTGKIGLDKLKQIKNEDGKSAYEMIKGFGFNPDRVDDYVLKPGEIEAIIELHIEQSVVLDSEKIPVGIVKAIAGLKWLKVTLKGLSNHAGATPMNLRKDPMVGAAKIINRIEQETIKYANETTVSTVGRFECYPNIPNAIPEMVSFTVDIRDVKPDGIEIVENLLRNMVDEVSRELMLESKIETMGESEGIKLSKRLINAIEESAKELNINYIKMNSGAVHDACLFGSLTDVGMIFVPSIDGRSHVPEEDTAEEDIKLGCDLLIDVLKRISI